MMNVPGDMESGKGRGMDEELLASAVSEETAHRISRDPWYQVGFVLTTGVNSAYVLGYSGTVMVPLGWSGGVVGFLLSAAFSLYANVLIASLHEVGGKRHIRYRDLAGKIYGPNMYYLTWALQYVNLFMINTGFIILAGQALKATYLLVFTDDDHLKLPHCIAVAGLVCAIFAFSIPHLSALRIWLGFSTFFSFIYIFVAFGLALRDGMNSPPRDYSVPRINPTKVFGIISAMGSLVFAYNTGMLPEIQATISPPVVKNMEKALYFQFTVGNVLLYLVAFVGYWAYGSSTSDYILNNVSGPVWLRTVANMAAFLQTVIALHVFASPAYEYLDTIYQRRAANIEKLSALQKISLIVLTRGSYVAVSTFVAALLPFIGDFMSLTGALSILPLTFVLANHMYLRAKRKELTPLQKTWHWLNVFGFGFLSAAAAAAAVRLIIIDSKTYHYFADLNKAGSVAFNSFKRSNGHLLLMGISK